MKAMVGSWLVRAAAILVVSYLGLGIHVQGLLTAVIAAVVLSLIDLVVRPLLLALTLPVTVLTFGLFIFVINGIMLWLVSLLVPGFAIAGLGGAVVASIVIGVVGTVLERLFRLL